MPKDSVIARIETGELASAPLSLDRTKRRNGGEIKVIPPGGEGNMRCNIYKTTRGGDVMYDISVVFIATAAYRKVTKQTSCSMAIISPEGQWV